MHDLNCIFCKIIAGEIPSKFVYQTDYSIVLQDIAPKSPIHYLIIPKKHIQDIAASSVQDHDVLADMMLVASYLSRTISGAEQFKLLANNGHNAGQRVFHLHFHFMAGKVFEE